MTHSKLSETAQKLVDAAVNEFNKSGSRARANLALDQAVYTLFEALPADNKARVTDTLIEIAQAYVERVTSSDPVIAEGVRAAIVKRGKYSPGFVVQLLEPLQGKSLAVVSHLQTRGTVDLWNKLGSEELEGVIINIIELRPGTDAFKVVEFTTPTTDGKVQRLNDEELRALRENRSERSSTQYPSDTRDLTEA